MKAQSQRKHIFYHLPVGANLLKIEGVVTYL